MMNGDGMNSQDPYFYSNNYQMCINNSPQEQLSYYYAGPSVTSISRINGPCEGGVTTHYLPLPLLSSSCLISLAMFQRRMNNMVVLVVCCVGVGVVQFNNIRKQLWIRWSRC